MLLADKYRQAIALVQRGQPASALAVCDEILAVRSDHFDTLMLAAMLAGQARDLGRAMQWLDRAIAVNPTHATAHCNRGFALQESSAWEESLASFDRAIALKPDYVLAHNNRGNVLRRLGRADEALKSYERALAIDAGAAHSHYNRGLALAQLGRWEEALASYDRAIARQPGYADAHSQRAIALYLLKRCEEAVASYDRAIAIEPRDGTAWSNRGNILRETNQLDAAVASFTQAIALRPDFAGHYLSRGAALHEQRRYDAAIADYDRAIAIDPGYAAAYYNRGNSLHSARRYEAAADSYLTAGSLDPHIKFLPGDLREARLQGCDWHDFDTELRQIKAGIERGEAVCHPFCMLALVDSPPLQRRAAQIWVRETCPADAALGPAAVHPPHAKIRIGYFSPDFRIHPVSSLAAEMFETHDRSTFEVTAFSFGPDTQDPMRKRLERAFDRFVDVRDRSDRQIAQLARSLELDIAVDLAGFTENSRPRIFALRSAPVQIGYLGYLGTMGADYIDYLVADRTLIPAESMHHYGEKILYLPSYQPNDSKRYIADGPVTRSAFGLPANGFVFCCFNASYKITPATFDGWMRILGRVDGSVLFLYAHTEAAARNLRKEAEARGVEPRRLVFGDRLPIPEYLARYRAADLFLDTLPYNAGTTASDALWVGLPILTCVGEGFASRVAASLLQAVRLPDLITTTRREYEDLAVALATQPERLAGIRRRLSAERPSAPLFDTPRHTQSLESAYRLMYERHRSGLSPAHLYVE